MNVNSVMDEIKEMLRAAEAAEAKACATLPTAVEERGITGPCSTGLRYGNRYSRRYAADLLFFTYAIIPCSVVRAVAYI